MFVLKTPKINEKEVANGPFKKSSWMLYPSVLTSKQNLAKVKSNIIDQR